MSADYQVIDLEVQGMTCASCAARIQKKLNKLDGVQASVNYATQRAHVVAGSEISSADLIEVIRNTGYDASLPNPEKPPIDRVAKIRRKLIFAVIFGAPLVVVSMIPALQFPAWQWVGLVLATPVVFWCGAGFHRSAIVNLKHLATTMDTLISMGTLASYLFSVYALLFGGAGYVGYRHTWHLSLTSDHAEAGIYFEASAAIIIFILIGRLIEAKSRQDASAALKALLEVGAKTVTVIKDGTPVVIPIEALNVDDEFVVAAGEKIGTDAIVISGQSAVDNSVITGESMPVEVGPGSRVFGGGVNANGVLILRATAVGADTQIAQIAHLVELAQTGKSQTQDLADKISAVFVPIVIVLALVTFVVWLTSGAGMNMAVTAGVSVLIISCPCALGLATPTALLAGSLAGSKMGVLIRGPQALEAARKIKIIVMDKTGTITKGVMTVVGASGMPQAQLLGLAASIEQGSKHPIAKAITATASATTTADNITIIPGRGVKGTVAGQEVVVGNLALMDGLEISEQIRLDAENFAAQGASLVYVAAGQRVLGVIAVADEVADGSKQAVRELERMGLATVMLTGDNREAAEIVAKSVGVRQVRAETMPSDKFAVIKELQQQGPTAMIGDGVNDAAALAQADLGISMGGGTDAAIAASDLTLMRHDLGLAVQAIKLSRRTQRTIITNLVWAFGYNVLAIPIAALGLLNPMIAGGAMALSSIFVVTNSLRLRWF